MIENNIFRYATEELTQDAVLSYIFNEFHNKEKNKREMAENFIKEFIFDNEVNKIDEIYNLVVDNSQMNERCKTKMLQNNKYGKIDICLEIDADGKKFLVLIEDKTATFLKENQIERELKNAITDKDKEVIYVLFKTKDNFELQYYYNYYENIKNYKNVKFKRRNEENFISALNTNVDDIIINMIKEYYNSIKIENEKEQKKNLLYRLNKNSSKNLINEIHGKFGNSNFLKKSDGYGYRTSVNINEKVKTSIKLEKNHPLYNLFYNSHIDLNIDWEENLYIDIMLGIWEEENYVSWKKLKNIENKAQYYENKRMELDKLRRYINDNYSQYRTKDAGKNKINLQVLKYKKNVEKENDELVKEVIECLNKIFKITLNIFKEYIDQYEI